MRVPRSEKSSPAGNFFFQGKIAELLGVPIGRVRFVGISTQAPLADDGALGEADVQVVLLRVDPEVEQAAELQLLRVAGTGSMEALLPRQEMDLNCNQLDALPDSVGKLTALQTLNLSGNRLAALPDSFGQLAALQTLRLGGNRLGALPDSFGQLAALQTLRFNDNQLHALPDSFGQLAALQILELQFNRLRALPDSFGQLAALQFLDLIGNRLRRNTVRWAVRTFRNADVRV